MNKIKKMAREIKFWTKFKLRNNKDRVRRLLLIIAKAKIANTAIKKLNFMMPKYFKKDGIIFIHVPKAAGTSIAKSLYGKTITHLPASFFSEVDKEFYESSYSFSVVRNPYTRLYSAYNFAKLGGTENIRISNRKKYRKELKTFEQFVKEWLPKKNLLKIDKVFQPQHHFLTKNGKIIVKEIFKMEEIHKCESRLSELTGRNIKFGNENRIDSSSNPLNFYDEKMIEIVNNLYAEDFKLFNYPQKAQNQ